MSNRPTDSNTTIRDCWENYRRQTFAPDTPPAILANHERSFVAGASYLLMTLITIVNPQLASLHNELERYQAELTANRDRGETHVQ